MNKKILYYNLSWMKGTILLLTLTCVMIPSITSAGVILTNPNSGNIQINFSEPLGQTFTTIDKNVKFAFYFTAINPSFPNNDALQVSLYEGAGVLGALLGSSSFNLSTGFEGFRDVDFTSINLDIGNVYTAVASILGDDVYWAIADTSDEYTGGFRVTSGITTSSIKDISFRVTGAAVTEPSTLVLLFISLMGIGFIRRKIVRPRHL